MVEGMSLRRFRSGIYGPCDELVGWLEKGCFDALSKGYLKSVMLVIYAHDEDEKAFESYSLNVSYPSRESGLNKATNALLSLTLEQQGNAKSIHMNDNNSKVPCTLEEFKQAMRLMLRRLCLSTQSLDPMPQTGRRTLNLHLTYYDDVTPPDYEPPGFMPSCFDLDTLFGAEEGKLLRLDCGTASGTHHSISLGITTRAAMASNPVAESQTYNCSNVAVKGTESSARPEAVKTEVFANKSEKKRLSLASQSTQPPVISSDGIRCTCGDYAQDLGMIECDTCKAWEHVVCAGFFSNQDKRLEGLARRSCFYCLYWGNKEAMHFLQGLCRMRRALSVTYGEGFTSKQAMAKRLGRKVLFLGIGWKSFEPIYRNLVEEGFLRILQGTSGAGGAGHRHEVVKTLEAKAAIKRYFNLDLKTTFPEFSKLVGENPDPLTPQPKRTKQSIVKKSLQVTSASQMVMCE